MTKVICGVCDKEIGCLIGGTRVVKNSRECHVAKAYELCNDYPGVTIKKEICEECDEERRRAC